MTHLLLSLPLWFTMTTAASPDTEAQPWTKCFEITATTPAPVSIIEAEGGAGQPARAVEDETLRMGGAVDLQLSRLKNGVSCERELPTRIAVFLDGIEMKGLDNPALMVESEDKIRARVFLDRRDGDADPEPNTTWRRLLRPAESGRRPLLVSLGDPGERPLATSPARAVNLEVATPYTWVWLAAVAGSLMFGFGFWLSRKGRNMLRDSTPVDSETGEALKLPDVVATKRSFSLARVQMLFWSCIVLACFIYLYAVLGVYNTLLTPQTLALMGLSGGTTLIAGQIDRSNGPGEARRRKRISATWEAKKSEDAAVQKEYESSLGRSQGLLPDLMTDASGFALHRVQTVAWTVLMGFVFIQEVPCTLSMPAFDTTLLLLLAISNGTYLAFKSNEGQPTP